MDFPPKYVPGDLEWLFNPSLEQPCTFDVDIVAVDVVNPWTRVARRVIPRCDAETLMGLSLKSAMSSHPHSRIHVKGLPHAHFKTPDELPVWMQECIAMLRMTDGNYVEGLGRRWPHTTEESRFYTIEWPRNNKRDNE